MITKRHHLPLVQMYMWFPEVSPQVPRYRSHCGSYGSILKPRSTSRCVSAGVRFCWWQQHTNLRAQLRDSERQTCVSCIYIWQTQLFTCTSANHRRIERVLNGKQLKLAIVTNHITR